MTARSSIVAMATAAALLPAGLAVAAPGAGTLDDPVEIDAFPYIAAGSTLDAASDAIDQYDCGPGLDESGGEVVYAFELAEPARVTAWVEGDDGVVDIDVHLLDELTLEGTTAVGCVARANTIAEAELLPGRHYVVVDTYDGEAQAGDFVLHAHAIGEQWFQMPVAQGVIWRARRPLDLDGVPQVLNVLHVDLDAPGIDLQVVLPPTCTTVAATAAAAGPTAVAAVNSSFFAACDTPVSFMKEGGVLLATNGSGVDRGAFGLDATAQPVVGRTAPGADWPEVVDGQGGIPLIVEDGVALQGPDAWAAEGLTSPGFIGPNPRTVLGYDAAGDLVLATVDGRRMNAAGMSLDTLATWSADALDGQGVVNLDGGGSTTMWISGVTPSGVVNYPSDAGMIEQADHGGSRAMVGAVVIHGQPYDWPPRFQTEPVLQAAVGEAYAYDADAIDLNVEDVVSYSVVTGPQGLGIDPVTGQIDYLPALEDPPMVEVTIEASDGTQATPQTWTLVIDGAQGPGGSTGGDGTAGSGDGGEVDDDGGDGSGTEGAGDGAGTGTGAAAGEDAGCGCRTATNGSGPEPWGWGLSCLVGLSRRRRRPRVSS